MVKNWYMAQVASGTEEAMCQEINETASFCGADEDTKSVVPIEMCPKFEKGKKVMVKKKLLPGYVLVNTDLSNGSWLGIRDCLKQKGKWISLLGSAGSPKPLSESEVARIFVQMEEGSGINEDRASFAVGQAVRVKTGPFEGFQGIVAAVDANGKLSVEMSILGRRTKVELDLEQIEQEC